MAVMRTHAVHMPPPVAASPGLPPVDPVKGRFSSMPIKPTSGELDVGHHDAETVATAMEPTLADEPYLPFEPPLPIDSSDLESTSGGLSPGQGVAPRMPPDLAEFLEVRAALEGSSNDEGKDWHEPDPALSGMDFSPSPTSTYEHSNGSNDEVPAKDRRTSVTGDFVEAANRDGEPLAMDSLGVDPANETGLPRVTTPARDFRRLPQRVADRPRIEEWTDDELLTLPEAAALFWPDGPITTNTLRTAGRDGTLAITKVAGKFFTTPMAIRRMGSQDDVGKPAATEPDEASATVALQMKIAEAQRLGGGRARSRRAAKRPVMPATSERAGR
jgi:hypothetical protein